ncbi:hypothetical protein SAMN05444274_102514 [Mariniphaga anaerophila]|uniref:Beta-barrel porin-2, OmpL-like. bbp2 n=1 Tax=Mariniphaga anaerophila TaxID=1484053 RepID=A0A1M4WPC7_9BACT|nr:hypothetical protein [Mariniphaga anaerophila]SHE83161.1 hypothetical protein SAMN05444274_102514 [Mariniphaga anaerophila]
MNKIIVAGIALLCAFAARSQSDEKPKVDIYGFVRVDAYVDSYKGVDAGHDIFYLLPLYVVTNGVEVNKQPSSNISAVASRLGVRVSFPEVLNAKATGLIEFDFAGNLKSDPTLFRIRQAYSLFSWEKSSLLVGQTWHPFFGGSAVPVVAGLNTGAPFSCFNRSPMIRYNMALGRFSVSAAAVSEMQYCSPLADMADFSFLLTTNHAKRNALVPELVFTTEYNQAAVTVGAGAGYKRIKPRMLISGTEESAVADEFLSSATYMAYGRYKKDKFMFLLKTYLGENMSHLVMPGGYGVASLDPQTGRETYTSYTTYTTSLSVVYGRKWRVGMFGGYGGNLGTDKPLYSDDGKAKTYGSFLNMQKMYRVAPHISLNLKNFRLVGEYEMTAANYGTGTIDFSNGLFSSTHKAINNRGIISLTHSF